MARATANSIVRAKITPATLQAVLIRGHALSRASMIKQLRARIANGIKASGTMIINKAIGP